MLAAAAEASAALSQADKIRQQVAITAARLDTLNQVARTASLLFKSNLASYLEVLTAQSNALQSQLALVDVRRQQSGVVIALYRALGGGWR